MSQIPSEASRRARRSHERHSTGAVCQSRDVDGNHVDRCEERERYRKRAADAGAEYGVPEVVMNDLWAHIGARTHNPLTAALVAEVVVDLGWRPPVDGKPAADMTAEPEASASEVSASDEGVSA